LYHGRDIVTLVIAALFIIASATVIRAFWRHGPLMPEECVRRYAEARNAADSSLVDVVIIASRTPQHITCGSIRVVGERRAPGSRPPS
jgi:hypothetical protein